MLSYQLLLIFGGCFFALLSFSQTGPGGVGNSLTNGVWLKADDILMNNGDPVSNWTDRSGNSNHAQNTDPTEQPVFIQNSPINNRPALYFNGVLDQLIIPDDPILDNSTSMTFLSVIRPDNLDNAPRGIIGKRISQNANVEYAYTFFFWNGDYLNLDIHTQNNRFNTSPTSFTNNVNYMPGFIFDGNLSTAIRSKVYESGNLITTSSESSTSLPNSNQDFCIGGLNTDYNNGGQKRLGGHFAEIIHYNYALNMAQRKIVENYLGAKYNIGVAHDLFNHEATHPGEVAGIGRDDFHNFHDDAQGSAIVRINNPSSLDNNDYLLWGHDETPITLNNIIDVDQVVVEARLERIWRVTETGDVGTVDVTFAISSFNPVNPSDLVLLIDRNHNGFYDNDVAPQNGIVTGGGDSITFSNVNFIDNDFFTLGSLEYETTPLPIELLDFYAHSLTESVELNWLTSSETNNDHFILQRSRDGFYFELLDTIDGAGNSTEVNHYSYLDAHPHNGISYYRLIQKDFNGDSTITPPISISRDKAVQGGLTIRPNPNKGTFTLSYFSTKSKRHTVRIINGLGKLVYQKELGNIANNEYSVSLSLKLPAGVYTLTSEGEDGELFKQKLIIQ